MNTEQHLPDNDPTQYSPFPRWERANHPDVAIHCAIADLTVQVARIANALCYWQGQEPGGFPDPDNAPIYGRLSS